MQRHMARWPNSSTGGSTKPPKKAFWTKLWNTECIWNNAQIIKQALGTMDYCKGLTHVIGPHSNNSNLWVESLTKAKLEQLCLAEAGRHFTQASTMSFLQPPLINLFTEANMYTDAFDQVFAGTFICPKNTDPMAQFLIQALQQPSPYTVIPTWMLDRRMVQSTGSDILLPIQFTLWPLHGRNV